MYICPCGHVGHKKYTENFSCQTILEILGVTAQNTERIGMIYSSI
jgi:hypothetical protein